MLVREANKHIWQTGPMPQSTSTLGFTLSRAAETCLKCSSDTGRTYNKVWRQSNNSREAPTAWITYNLRNISQTLQRVQSSAYPLVDMTEQFQSFANAFVHLIWNDQAWRQKIRLTNITACNNTVGGKKAKCILQTAVDAEAVVRWRYFLVAYY